MNLLDSDSAMDIDHTPPSTFLDTASVMIVVDTMSAADKSQDSVLMEVDSKVM